MASRQGWLVNKVNPELAKSSMVDVREGAVRLTCSGVTGSTWQVLVGDNEDTGTWVDVVRFGKGIVFSAANSQYVEGVAGRYRVNPSGLGGTAKVYFQEDEQTDHDSKIVYVFGQENVDENAIQTAATSSVTPGGNGTIAAPLTETVKISADAGNGLSIHSDGLFAISGSTLPNVVTSGVLTSVSAVLSTQSSVIFNSSSGDVYITFFANWAETGAGNQTITAPATVTDGINTYSIVSSSMGARDTTGVVVYLPTYNGQNAASGNNFSTAAGVTNGSVAIRAIYANLA